MAKAASPVRLQSELMEAASVTGRQMHRSAAEQIEYWASLGRSVAKLVDPNKLLAVSTGMAEINIVPITSAALNPDDVFKNLERSRELGSLAKAVTESNITYQASRSHPGQLEQIDENGKLTVGRFADGVFTPTGGLSTKD